MENKPVSKSKKWWWIGGGVIALFILIGVGGSSSNNNPTSTAVVSPTSQTANVAQQLSVPSAQPQTPATQSNLSNDNSYVNSDGNIVHSPSYSDTVPAGATAQCRDHTYSLSKHRSGTCSHHGGVATWL
jgi:hypothetical protein